MLSHLSRMVNIHTCKIEIHVFFFLMFIYLERETTQAKLGGPERERENPKQALCCQCGA